MLWNPGKSDVEIFLNSFLLIFFIVLELNVKILCRKIFESRKAETSDTSSGDAATGDASVTKMQQLEAEIRQEERRLEKLNSPDTFVEYAISQRKLNTKRKELELLKQKEKPRELSPALSAFQYLGLGVGSRDFNKLALTDKLLQNRVSENANQCR